MSAEIRSQRSDRQFRPRPTIGLLLDYVNSNTAKYQTMVWDGIANAAKINDVNLICFVGGTLASPTNKFEAQRNVIYELPNPDNVDGLIIIGSLGIFVPVEQFRAFHLHYRPLPTVSINTPLEGIPSILVEDRKGMHSIVSHLIEFHGYRRIGFIQGPRGNPGADDRYDAYIETLSEHGLSLDLDLVAPGDFMPGTGAAAIDLLFNERKLQPGVDLQAIVAANDNMALAAMESLQMRGIQVPYDVAIVGFDDIEHCSAATPSLTTVCQPIREVTRQAVETLLAMLSGKPVPDQIALPTKLAVRQSCGCGYLMAMQAEKDIAENTQTLAQVLSTQRQCIIAEMLQAIEAPVDGQEDAPDWPDQLLDAFAANLGGEGPNEAFLHTLDTIIRQVAKQGTSVSSWQEIVSILRKHTLPYLKGETLSQAIELWAQSWVLIGEIATHVPVQQKLRAEQKTNMLYDANQALITQMDVTVLMDVAARELPRLGIKQCYISLYEDPSAPTQYSWLILAYDETGRHPLREGGNRYSTRQLVPSDLLPQDKSYHLLVDSLYLEEERIGLVVFGVGTLDGVTYATLQAQLSGALKGVLLLHDRQQVEQDLGSANRELEQFALAASNGLQEPLQMVSGYLQLLERRYKGELDESADEFIRFAVDGATRMQDLINDLLVYSRVEVQDRPFKPTACDKVLDNVLTNLKIAIEESGAMITHDPLPTLLADDVQLVQLFQNLLGNAIKFRKQDAHPAIHVGVERHDDYWQFAVCDNGIGIDPQHGGRLFMIFQRLHNREEYPGTGIGLAICKKIVGHYGGRIWVESEADQGATFYFTLPVMENTL